MAALLFLQHQLLLSVFGILGNILSVFVFLGPVLTFIEIYRAGSTMGFDSMPYILALLASKLWLYYGFIKENAILLIFISSAGIVIETVYILIFLVFASRQERCRTLRELLLCIGVSSLIFVVSWFGFSGEIRVSIVGWTSVAISITVFASPVSIVLDAVITTSVEFLKIYLSFFIALSAIMWLCFGFLLSDMCIMLPSIFAFVLGFVQILVYTIYWERNPVVEEDEYVAEFVMNMRTVYPMDSGRNSSASDAETNLELEVNHQRE